MRLNNKVYLIISATLMTLTVLPILLICQPSMADFESDCKAKNGRVSFRVEQEKGYVGCYCQSTLQVFDPKEQIAPTAPQKVTRQQESHRVR